jgi:hypothetical protein
MPAAEAAPLLCLAAAPAGRAATGIGDPRRLAPARALPAPRLVLLVILDLRTMILSRGAALLAGFCSNIGPHAEFRPDDAGAGMR